MAQAEPKSGARQGAVLQRKCACGQHTGGGECESCRKKKQDLQRKGNGPQPAGVPPIVHDVLRSSGQPLDSSARAFMSSRFGRDFSQVRVHNDAKAAASAEAVSAQAYTVGKNIVFGEGRYIPDRAEGMELLAHELTHVVQQAGAGLGETRDIELGASADHFEREADSVERSILGQKILTSPWSAAPKGVQRRPVDPLENSAGSPVKAKGGVLPYREATHLLKCIETMGEANAEYCRPGGAGAAHHGISTFRR